MILETNFAPSLHSCGAKFLPLNILWRFLPLDILLSFFKSENVNHIISKYLEIEIKSKTCLTNLDFVQSYAPMHKFCACWNTNCWQRRPSQPQWKIAKLSFILNWSWYSQLLQPPNHPPAPAHLIPTHPSRESLFRPS